MQSVQGIQYLLLDPEKVTRQGDATAAAVTRCGVGGKSLQVTHLYVYLCVDMHLFMIVL